MLTSDCALYNDCKKVLVSEEEIHAIVVRLAAEIEETYRDLDHPLTLVVILKGSMPFAADLMKQLRLPVRLEFMKVSSYGAATKSLGEIKVQYDSMPDNLMGADLLVVEDIVDSGRTLSRLTALLKNRNAGSVRSCTLLDKPSRREASIKADYVGFTIPNEFVVGYGLDFAEHYRNLPYIGVLKPEIYG